MIGRWFCMGFPPSEGTVETGVVELWSNGVMYSNPLLPRPDTPTL
jgi:hypothetical protein